MKRVLHDPAYSGDAGAPARGPALVRRRQRRLPRDVRRERARHAAICGCVNFRPEYQSRWMQRSYYQQLPLAAAGAGGDPRAAARSAGRGPERRGAARGHSRAHQGQPVLHRGGGAVAGRERAPGGSARRLPADDAGRGAGGAGQRAGGAGGAHRSAAGAREAGAADRGGDRQDVQRGAARPGRGERRDDRTRRSSARRSRRWWRRSSSTRRRSIRSSSTPSSTR